MKFNFLFIAAALCASAAFAQAPTSIPVSAPEMTASTPLADATSGPVVDITTTLGPIKIKLYDDTPLHRDNFLKLVASGYYDGVLFHRVIKDFMVQTGDPESKNAKPGQPLGLGDPGYTIPAEINYPRHFHKYGALCAARTADQVNPERRSSGSQFYIVTGRKADPRQIEMMSARANDQARQTFFRQLVERDKAQIDSLQKSGDKEALEALRQKLIAETMENVAETSVPAEISEAYTTVGGAPHLDGQYTVFGEVTEGMDVVEKIQNAQTDGSDRPTDDIRIISMIIEPAKPSGRK